MNYTAEGIRPASEGGFPSGRTVAAIVTVSESLAREAANDPATRKAVTESLGRDAFNRVEQMLNAADFVAQND